MPQVSVNNRQSVNTLISYRCGSFQLHNLVHSFTGLAALVHLFAVRIHHDIGAMTGDGFNLTIGATRFQEIYCRVLTKTVKGVFMVVTT